VWSDWASEATVALANGIRLDANYYYWPSTWVADRPGFFTGSGIPMRFAAIDGSVIDVYQATTQLTDESGQRYPFTIDTLLDRALGPLGYYGAFTANMHTDDAASPGSDAIVASAQSRGIPIVSARQMLAWLNGRDATAVAAMSWDGGALGFTVQPGVGAAGLQVMVPARSSAGRVMAVSRGGQPLTFSTQTVKGVEYATFDAVAGTYEVRYA
jgi:hypothetical protein